MLSSKCDRSFSQCWACHVEAVASGFLLLPSKRLSPSWHSSASKEIFVVVATASAFARCCQKPVCHLSNEAFTADVLCSLRCLFAKLPSSRMLVAKETEKSEGLKLTEQAEASQMPSAVALWIDFVTVIVCYVLCWRCDKLIPQHQCHLQTLFCLL